MTPQQIEALKLALEALEYLGTMHFQHTGEALYQETFTAIEDALKEHAMQEVQRLGQEIEQEPVAWWDAKLGAFDEKHFDQLQPLYTAPPQRKPLSAEQVSEICAEWTDENGNTNSFGRRQIARAIEAAHGIKEST